ncbi:glycosyltransferase family 2 protein [Vibrio metschnikovii]|uniref:glycosyltransferase family 2 protein n=1 Tax=Vibrio metschnikovii TaxID=28172 RepID=UPI001C30B4A5|nr:glycosyltransferase family 2 protein [Vibrio metschnikovii]
MISFVIPLFNKSDYISEAIQSILDSDKNNVVEIIVVDDCSTDDSVDRVKAFNDDRVVLEKLEQNKGPSNARNVGVTVSKNDFIFFLDADDVINVELVPVLLEKITDNLNYLCVGISFFLGNNIPEYSDVGEYTMLSKNAYHRFLVKNNFVFTASSTLINKRVFLSLGGFNTLSNYTEDSEFWARLSNTYEGYYLSRTLSYYRLVEGSLSDQFINRLSELPILLITLDEQAFDKDKFSDESIAFCYMTLKYYLIASSTNSSIARELYKIYLKNKSRFSYSTRFLWFILRFIPSSVTLTTIKLKRKLRELILRYIKP